MQLTNLSILYHTRRQPKANRYYQSEAQILIGIRDDDGQHFWHFHFGQICLSIKRSMQKIAHHVLRWSQHRTSLNTSFTMTRRSSSKRARSRDGCVDTDSCNGMWEPVYAQQAGTAAGAAEAAGALAPMLKRSRASPTCSSSSTTTALTTAPWSLASVSATSSSLQNIMMTMQEQEQQQPQQYQYSCHQADDDCGMGCEPDSSTSPASASSWPFQQQQEHTAVASLSTQDHSMPSTTADLAMCDAPAATAPATAPDLSELPDAYWNEWAGQSDVY